MKRKKKKEISLYKTSQRHYQVYRFDVRKRIKKNKINKRKNRLKPRNNVHPIYGRKKKMLNLKPMLISNEKSIEKIEEKNAVYMVWPMSAISIENREM